MNKIFEICRRVGDLYLKELGINRREIHPVTERVIGQHSQQIIAIAAIVEISASEPEHPLLLSIPDLKRRSELVRLSSFMAEHDPNYFGNALGASVRAGKILREKDPGLFILIQRCEDYSETLITDSAEHVPNLEDQPENAETVAAQ